MGMKRLGLVPDFVAGGKRRRGRATMDLYAVSDPSYAISDQKMAYICKVNQSPVGNNIAMISLFTMSWRMR